MIPGVKLIDRGRRWLGHRLTPGRVGVVLLYHQVTATGRAPGDMAVAADRFADHMAMLAERYTLLDLADLVDRAQRRRLPPGAVAVTFDDGYANVLHTAAPAMRRHGVPATCFMVSGAVGGRFAWESAASEDARPLDVDELRELARSVTIGAHTVTHPSLRRLNDASLEREIIDSKAALEALTGEPIDRFAYPFGQRSDLDNRTVRVCRSAGFRLACTAWDDAVGRRCDPWRIGRLWVSSTSAGDLDRRLRRWLGGRAR